MVTDTSDEYTTSISGIFISNILKQPGVKGVVSLKSTQVRRFKAGGSGQDFLWRKNPQRAFLWTGSKAVGPMSQIFDM
jgi:hypothetical protein